MTKYKENFIYTTSFIKKLLKIKMPYFWDTLYFGIMWKVLLQGINMCNYKSPITSGSKVMAKV